MDMKQTVAYDANEGLIKSLAFAPDIVISDIRMPGGGGISLLERISSLQGNKPIVFLITGYADISKEEAISKRAVDIFSKPIRLQEIYDRVITHLN